MFVNGNLTFSKTKNNSLKITIADTSFTLNEEEALVAITWLCKKYENVFIDNMSSSSLGVRAEYNPYIWEERALPPRFRDIGAELAPPPVLHAVDNGVFRGLVNPQEPPVLNAGDPVFIDAANTYYIGGNERNGG
jgi:hypothetical protein